MLFRTGNGRPAEHFGNAGGFSEQLALRDYRGALALDEPTLYVDQYGYPVRVTFWRFSAVGYTPVRIGDLTYYCKGYRASAWKATTDENRKEVTIQLWVRFKITWLGDLAGWILTGRRAPWATILITYTLSRSGEIMVRADGSRVPSQSTYVDWQKRHEYEMDQGRLAHFEEFMNTGACRDSMGYVRWRGQSYGKLEYV